MINARHARLHLAVAGFSRAPALHRKAAVRSPRT
jgi:hypothetical protein